jgi:hypothetical protein
VANGDEGKAWVKKKIASSANCFFISAELNKRIRGGAHFTCCDAMRCDAMQVCDSMYVPASAGPIRVKPFLLFSPPQDIFVKCVAFSLSGFSSSSRNRGFSLHMYSFVLFRPFRRAHIRGDLIANYLMRVGTPFSFFLVFVFRFDLGIQWLRELTRGQVKSFVRHDKVYTRCTRCTKQIPRCAP